MPDENTTEQVGTEQVTPAAESVPAAAGGTATEGRKAEEPAPAKPAKKTAKKAPAKKAAARKSATKKAAAPADEALPIEGSASEEVAAAEPAPAKKTAKKAPAKKAAAKKSTSKKTAAEPAADAPAEAGAAIDGAATDEAASADQPAEKPAKKAAAKKSTTKKTTARKKAAPEPEAADEAAAGTGEEAGDAPASQAPLFQAPSAAKRTTTRKAAAAKVAAPADEDAEEDEVTEADAAETDATEADATATDADETDAEDTDAEDGDETEGEEGGSPARRRRRRGGRRRRRGGSGGQGGETPEGDDDQGEDSSEQSDSEDAADPGDGEGDADAPGEGSGSSRRRRRRRRSGDGGGDDSGDDPANTVTRVRSSRTGEDQITALSGSTRLEAKKQRRREGREAGRRRAPIVSEAEFLARRESVERVMVIREREDLTQIGVLEDKVLVEHYVARESQTSLIGNVYLGRVQNVLPSMEAAFIDIGKGRNAVLYAGEVNWSALGHKDGQPRKIESVLSSGQPVLVQVTKDPIGAKGARLTSQISLAGRFLVYVPDGTTSGISRKLPDTERSRLKALLKELVPDTAGVIVRTAAEGASEEELTRDVERLKARWEDIEKKAKGSAPQLLYGEPDLTLKVVRDLFTEDFAKLVIQGDDAWETVQSYVTHVAPDLAERLERFEPATEGRDKGKDVFAAYRVDEQIAKGLDRKVWLPSGGSLVIDRTEAMTVVDVNTGKFTGSGGNLEETVTKNNLEAAEEVVRQLRLRDIGGIIVVDFIDMVLESNRDLVLRRLVECLGRDRTRHQVAEVTSLGLVQMTRKRIGTGLLEAFSESCTHCQGRGLVIHDHPVEPRGGGSDDDRGGRGNQASSGGKRSRGGRGKGEAQSGGTGSATTAPSGPPSPKDIAAMPRHDKADESAAPSEPTGSTEATGATTDEQPAGDAAGTSGDQGRQTSSDRGSRGNRSRKPAAEPSQEPTAETTADTTPEPTAEATSDPGTAAPRAAEPQAPATEPEARTEPAAEKPAASSGVVTRTRRAARRTGPLTTGEGAAVVVEATAPAPASEQAVETSTPAPKVVTRTRSSRTARPATTGPVEPGTADTEPAPASGASAEEGSAPSTVEHVPVKRKGSRKR